MKLTPSALPLLRSQGFSARIILALNPSLTPHALNALHGPSPGPERALARAWLDLARAESVSQAREQGVRGMLRERLRWNEELGVDRAAEALALAVTPDRVKLPFGWDHFVPAFNPLPLLAHGFSMADAIASTASLARPDLSWYPPRLSLASVYLSTELHQLSEDATLQSTYAFLDRRLEDAERVKGVVQGSTEYADYIARSWISIIKSRGL